MLASHSRRSHLAAAVHLLEPKQQLDMPLVTLKIGVRSIAGCSPCFVQLLILGKPRPGQNASHRAVQDAPVVPASNATSATSALTCSLALLSRRIFSLSLSRLIPAPNVSSTSAVFFLTPLPLSGAVEHSSVLIKCAPAGTISAVGPEVASGESLTYRRGSRSEGRCREGASGETRGLGGSVEATSFSPRPRLNTVIRLLPNKQSPRRETSRNYDFRGMFCPPSRVS